ncbi:MAG TPA: hypothetical protein VLG50_05110 [Candidatus Saccharimonadales bacterium]|nr:hypothetical protein [Candidatus Saccharimonadales bacterium]
MEIIIEKEKDLVLSYASMPIYPTTGDSVWYRIKNFGYDVYVLSIGVKDKENINCFLSVSEALSRLKVSDGVGCEGLCTYDQLSYYFLKKDIIDIKDEYKNEINKLNQKNEDIKTKFNHLVKQLENLGCYCDDLEPKYESIPDEWYNYHTYYDLTRANIRIYYHQHSTFYEYLNSKGLFDRIKKY